MTVTLNLTSPSVSIGAKSPTLYLGYVGFLTTPVVTMGAKSVTISSPAHAAWHRMTSPTLTFRAHSVTTPPGTTGPRLGSPTITAEAHSVSVTSPADHNGPMLSSPRVVIGGGGVQYPGSSIDTAIDIAPYLGSVFTNISGQPEQDASIHAYIPGAYPIADPAEPVFGIGDADSPRLWYKYTPTYPGVMQAWLATAAGATTYTTETDAYTSASPGIYTDVYDFNNGTVRDGHARTIDLNVTPDTTYYFRAWPYSATDLQDAAMVVQVTERVPTLTLQWTDLNADGTLTVPRTPINTRVNVLNGTPNGSVNFYLDGTPGTIIGVANLNDVGVAISVPVTLPAVNAGNHVLYAAGGGTAAPALIVGTSNFSSNADNIVGNESVFGVDNMALAFAGLAIPVGATITAATLTWFQNGFDGTTGFDMKIVGDKQANPGVVANQTDYNGRVRTTATAAFAPSDVSAIGAGGYVMDVTAIVAELILVTGYSGASVVQLLVDDNGTTSGTDLTLGNAQLLVAYTLAGGAPTGSLPFHVTLAPRSAPTDPSADTTPDGVTLGSWTFIDLASGGLGSYVFPNNPTSMTSPFSGRVYTNKAATAPRSNAITFEGAQKPAQWSAQGTTLDQGFTQELEKWVNLNKRFVVVDHHGRGWAVSFENYDAVPTKDNNQRWAMTYTLSFIVYAGPLSISFG